MGRRGGEVSLKVTSDQEEGCESGILNDVALHIGGGGGCDK